MSTHLDKACAFEEVENSKFGAGKGNIEREDGDKVKWEPSPEVMCSNSAMRRYQGRVFINVCCPKIYPANLLHRCTTQWLQTSWCLEIMPQWTRCQRTHSMSTAKMPSIAYMTACIGEMRSLTDSAMLDSTPGHLSGHSGDHCTSLLNARLKGSAILINAKRAVMMMSHVARNVLQSIMPWSCPFNDPSFTIQRSTAIHGISPIR